MGVKKKSGSDQDYLLAKWLGIAFVIPSYHRTIRGKYLMYISPIMVYPPLNEQLGLNSA